jgi:stage V sporulation protein G
VLAVEITEVRIKLMPLQNDKLRAFCSITIDDAFVIRDLKVIEGNKGPFVAMPSRKLMERCARCGGKNHHRAAYCNECGLRLEPGRVSKAAPSRQKLHADIAHPINSRSREHIQRRILEQYEGELEKAKDPNYQPSDLDVFDEDSLCDGGYEEASPATNGVDAQREPAEMGGPRSFAPESSSDGARRVRAMPQVSAERERPAFEPKPRIRSESESEDNFGAGLFS